MKLLTFILLIVLPILVAGAPTQPLAAPLPIAAAATGTATPEPTAEAQEEATGTNQTGAEITPKAALERLFSAKRVAKDWFSSDFIDQVSIAQLNAILDQISQALGKYQGVEGDSSPFTVVFELGTLTTEITLDADGQIAGLFFHPPALNAKDIDDAVDKVSELSGDVSLLVLKNDEILGSLNPDKALAVGSAFKLAVLRILRQQIEAGEHDWDEVVTLKPEWKNIPTGILQNWPDDSPLTISTLATLMISISDNTAADALLELVGRDNVEAISPHNHPFLSVQELAKLKSTANAALLERYLKANLAKKRQILKTLATLPVPSAQELSLTPILDVEWFFTGEELCELMAQVQDLDLMTVEPGPGITQPDRWSRVAFKGGSDFGVINLTTWLETEAGDSYCVTMTQNVDEGAIDEARFVTLYRTMMNVLD